jgi:SRSO17 transposase
VGGQWRVAQSWAEDRDRRRAAGIPEEVEFATEPRQAQAMIARAIAAAVPFAWFTADETYGQAKWLRAWLEDQDIWYVMAIRCIDTLTTPAGERRADALIGGVPARAWQRISTGAGAHGPREYHWARIPVRPGRRSGRWHWLLARRSLSDPAEIAYYACYVPRRSKTADLAWIAGSRWHIEVGHCWRRSRHVAFSWLCSLFLVRFPLRLCPAGAGVEARRACPALA